MFNGIESSQKFFVKNNPFAWGKTDPKGSSSEFSRKGDRMRTITSRNMLGGFCGGILGILAFSIFSLLLPVGCLLGVVIGFWYQEIWAGIKTESRKTMDKWQRFYNDAIIAPRDRFRVYLGNLKARLWDREDASGIFYIIARVLIGALRLCGKLVQLIIRTCRWPFKHHMNGVYLVTATAAAIFAAGLIYVVFTASYNLTIPTGLEEDVRLTVLIVPLIVVLFLPISSAILTAFNCADPNDDIGMIRAFYKDWERYDRHGLFYHLGYKLVVMIKVCSAGLLWEVLGLAYIATGLVAVVAFMAIPIGITKATLRVLWQMTNRTNHWLCFAVTLTITTASALLLAQYLHGTGLWLVALLTGSMAGIASEVARRFVATLLILKPTVMAFANRKCEDPIDELIVPLWKNNWSWLRKYFIGWIPMLPEGFDFE